MTKIKKGSEVWMITDWNHRATVSVRKLTVDSLGKKQGTAHCTENGEMIQCFIRPRVDRRHGLPRCGRR